MDVWCYFLEAFGMLLGGSLNFVALGLKSVVCPEFQLTSLTLHGHDISTLSHASLT